MGLITKIKLEPKFNWKSIYLTDLTGFGITGYGANQDPQGARRLLTPSVSGLDLSYSTIGIIPPGGTETLVTNSFLTAYNIAISNYEITNTNLGLSFDDYLNDGIWNINYTLFFAPYLSGATGAISTLTKVGSTNVFTFSGTYLNFLNVNSLYVSSTNGRYLVSNLDKINSKITITPLNGIVMTSPLSSNYFVGYKTTLYVPIARAIKECLDNKIADIALCECEDVDCILVNKYLLYEAMFVNCSQGNLVKAQQIFDLLTKYCGNNCGC